MRICTREKSSEESYINSRLMMLERISMNVRYSQESRHHEWQSLLRSPQMQYIRSTASILVRVVLELLPIVFRSHDLQSISPPIIGSGRGSK